MLPLELRDEEMRPGAQEEEHQGPRHIKKEEKRHREPRATKENSRQSRHENLPNGRHHETRPTKASRTDAHTPPSDRRVEIDGANSPPPASHAPIRRARSESRPSEENNEVGILATSPTTTPSVDGLNSGLPPTPPTITSSDVSAPRDDSLSSNPQFADAVRNALRSQKSGVSTPAGRQLAPQTPGPSPPDRREERSENYASAPRPQLLLPYAHLNHTEPSSGTDSVHTAQENTSQPGLPRHSNPMGHVYMTTDDQQFDTSRRDRRKDLLPHILPTRNTASESYQLPGSTNLSNRAPRASSSPARNGTAETPSTSHHKSHSTSLSATNNTHKRVKHNFATKDNDTARLNRKTNSLMTPQEHQMPDASAEDVNNLVYQEIRADNAVRHTAVSNGTAMPVGVIFPPVEKERTLKRTAKCESLREHPGTRVASQPNSPTSPQLRHKPAQRSLSVSSPVQTGSQRMPPKPAVPTPASNASDALKIPKIRQSATDAVATAAATATASVPQRQHTLRHSRGDIRVRKDSNGSASTVPSHSNLPLRSVSDSRQTSPPVERTLRHFSHNAKLENNSHVRRTSLEPPHSPRKSLDARLAAPTTTPLSTSQFSDRTEMEVCEAQGISIYPHNNKSLLMVDHSSRPVSKHDEEFQQNNKIATKLQSNAIKSGFGDHAARPQTPPFPRIQVDNDLDSPSLRHPRAAPEPPMFRVTAPTPNRELESEMIFDDTPEKTSNAPGMPQRRRSLMQKARRYSESFVQPLFARTASLRKQKRRMSTDDNEDDGRPPNLSPMWRPRDFWEGMDSDDEYDDEVYAGPDDGYGPKQSASDTNERTLPRNMSVRMPGFRGSGGFLVGNSLGLNRHGTNNRRHYVVRPRATSEEITPGAKRTFSLPFVSTGRSDEVQKPQSAKTSSGIAAFRERLSNFRIQNEERKAEKRREELRGLIQHDVP